MALGLSVTLPLKDTERVGETDAEPEDVKLVLGEKELLTVGQLEGDCVVQCEALLL